MNKKKVTGFREFVGKLKQDAAAADHQVNLQGFHRNLGKEVAAGIKAKMARVAELGHIYPPGSKFYFPKMKETHIVIAHDEGHSYPPGHELSIFHPDMSLKDPQTRLRLLRDAKKAPPQPAYFYHAYNHKGEKIGAGTMMEWGLGTKEEYDNPGSRPHVGGYYVGHVDDEY